MDIMEMGANDELVSKWNPALDGIENDYTKRVTAQLLENQLKSAQERVDEAAYGPGTTTVGSIGTFQKFAFPLVRRVFPELIANNLVSVQPMSAPVSQVFYLGSARVYGSDRQNLYSKYQLTYRGKVTGEPEFAGIGTSSLTQMLGTTQENFGGSALTQEPATAGEANMASAIANWPNSTFAQGWSVSAGERLAGSAIPEVTMSIEQQPVIARTKKMRALWTLEASQDLKAYHNLDLERELTDLLGKEIRLEVDRELIENLRGLAYDLTGTHGSLYNKNMLDQATNQGALGNFEPASDSTFGDFLFAPAGGDSVPQGVANIPGIPGSYTVGRNTYLFDFNNTAFTDFAPRHIGDKYANLLAVINHASQDIYKSTQRGAGNWIICAPVMATLLETAARLTGGIEAADAPTNFGPGTIQFRGKFMGRYDLFVDPLYPEGEIMMGYKGSSPMDGGFIYAPYIPFQALPTITDPESFQPRKGILTRYGKVAVAPASRFYRIIRMSGTEGITAGIDQRLPLA